MTTQANAMRKNERNTAVSKTDVTKEDMIMRPRVNIVEDSGGFRVMAEIPGVPKDQVNVHLDGDTLTIDAVIALDVPEAMKATHAEVHTSRYRRAFTLSRDLDGNHIEAMHKNGVLNLRIPKAEHAQPRKIEVQVA